MTSIVFDARSAGTQRLTGWERYTRSLLSVIAEMPSFEVMAPNTVSLPRRVLSDWVSIPWIARGKDLVHFPSFPPASNVDLRRAVVTIHDLTWWKFQKAASVGGRYYYKRLADRSLQAAAVVTVSETVAAEIRDLWPEANVHVVSPVVNKPRSTDGVFPWHKPYILLVGSIEPRKNLAAFAEAFKNAGVSEDLDLLLVGRRAWGSLPDGVTELGPVPDRLMMSLMVNAKSLACPSFYEGFGLPVAEAASAGVRVICSDIPVFREVVPDSEFFDPYSVESMTSAIRQVARSVTHPLCEEGTLFTRERTRTQLTSLYSSLGVSLE